MSDLTSEDLHHFEEQTIEDPPYVSFGETRVDDGRADVREAVLDATLTPQNVASFHLFARHNTELKRIHNLLHTSQRRESIVAGIVAILSHEEIRHGDLYHMPLEEIARLEAELEEYKVELGKNPQNWTALTFFSTIEEKLKNYAVQECRATLLPLLRGIAALYDFPDAEMIRLFEEACTQVDSMDFSQPDEDLDNMPKSEPWEETVDRPYIVRPRP